MSWLVSRALVEEYLEESSLDGEQSVQWKSIPIAQAYLPNDRMMAFSRPSQFGMTFAPLMDELGEDVLTWFREVFPAKTSVSVEQGLALKESVPAFGQNSRELLAKWNPETFSWKTAQLSLIEGESESLLTLPDWGMSVDGELWALTPLVDQWNESGFGLPAPTKSMGKRGWGISTRKRRWSVQLEENALIFGYKPHPSVLEWSMGWIPTWTRLKPLAMDKFQKWLNSHGKH